MQCSDVIIFVEKIH